MKIMLVISYDGSKFKGFQRQKDVRNVQGYLESVLSHIYNEDIIIKGAGRTDANVHAKYQVVHFECDHKIANLKRELNKELKDIKVRKVKKVASEFHARHSVKLKTYLYKLDTTGKKDNNYYGICKSKLDLKTMQEGSKIFLGTHDYHNFASGDKNNFKTTITKIKIYQFNNIIYFKFTGYAFYRYMVRNLVGALIHLGKGKISIANLKELLDSNIDKRLPTASPNGLYLIKIIY